MPALLPRNSALARGRCSEVPTVTTKRVHEKAPDAGLSPWRLAILIPMAAVALVCVSVETIFKKHP